jgi:hypothetical protein
MPPKFDWEKLRVMLALVSIGREILVIRQSGFILGRWRSKVWREGLRLEGVSMKWDHR